MKIKGKWVILAGAVVVAGLFAVFGLNRGAHAQHFTAKVERGEIDDVVEATGTINAVITVQVGSQVSGTIAKLNADFNSRVHKGDIVALIPALFRGFLQATADLENAKANLVGARANLEKAKAGLVQTKADYDRAVGLFKGGILSEQQLDLAKANYDSANAGVGRSAGRSRNGESPSRAENGYRGCLETRSGQHLEPIQVTLGITDHAHTEATSVLKGQLNEGDEVIIRSVVPKSQALGGIRR